MPSKGLDALLADLGSNTFKTRKAAEASLKKMGPKILPRLLPLLESTDAEIAERIKQIVQHLKILQLLPPLDGKPQQQAKGLRYGYGDVLERMGDLERAASEFSWVAQTDINFRDVRNRLDAVRKKLREQS